MIIVAHRVPSDRAGMGLRARSASKSQFCGDPGMSWHGAHRLASVTRLLILCRSDDSPKKNT